MEFIRRFLQHVLPKGFVKVRYYGIFSLGWRKRLAKIRRHLQGDSEVVDEQETTVSEAEVATSAQINGSTRIVVSFLATVLTTHPPSG